MPIIADTSQQAALRLQRASGTLAPTDDDSIVIQTGWPSGAGFFVSDELFAAWEADLATEADVPIPPPRQLPCSCVEFCCPPPAPPPAPTLASIAPNTALAGAGATTVTLTGTDFIAPMTVSVDAPGVEAPVVVTATVVSPTSATVVVPASALDTAGATTLTATTPGGTTAAQTLTVT